MLREVIVDAQLPRTLTDLLRNQGLDCIHTFDLPLQNASSDLDILKTAKEEDRIVITKDDDFLNSYLIFNSPKKLILVKTGNIKNGKLLDLFSVHLDKILTALKFNTLVEISQKEIVVHK